MILDITKIFLKIKKSSDGIFYTSSNHSISYPTKGNELCMQVEDSSFWFNHRNNIIAETIKKYLRPGDMVARYGGEELFALLPGMDIQATLTIAERLRQAIKQTEVSD